MDLDSIISIVKQASKLMMTDKFEITQKCGYADIVTSSDMAVQDFCARSYPTYCQEAGSCVKKLMCTTLRANTHG